MTTFHADPSQFPVADVRHRQDRSRRRGRPRGGPTGLDGARRDGARRLHDPPRRARGAHDGRELRRRSRGRATSTARRSTASCRTSSSRTAIRPGPGNGGPGYEIRDEINPLPYRAATVGMALSGPDTGGSQWFVTQSAAAPPRRRLHGLRPGRRGAGRRRTASSRTTGSARHGRRGRTARCTGCSRARPVPRSRRGGSGASSWACSATTSGASSLLLGIGRRHLLRGPGAPAGGAVSGGVVLATRELPEPFDCAARGLRGPGARLRARASCELAAEVPGVDALICLVDDAVTATVIQAADRLKIIASYAVGVDQIDRAAAAAARHRRDQHAQRPDRRDGGPDDGAPARAVAPDRRGRPDGAGGRLRGLGAGPAARDGT